MMSQKGLQNRGRHPKQVNHQLAGGCDVFENTLFVVSNGNQEENHHPF